MANKKRNELTLELDKTRTWRLRFKEMALIEFHLQLRRNEKISFTQFLQQGQLWTVEDYQLVIWAGLLSEDPGLKEEQVSEWLDYSFLLEFQGQFWPLMGDAIPESAKKKAAELRAAAIPTSGAGTISSSVDTDSD